MMRETISYTSWYQSTKESIVRSLLMVDKICPRGRFRIVVECIYAYYESLNSDGQQFHKYQQNEQSPLTFTHRTQKRQTKYDIGNQGLGLGQAYKCGGFQSVKGIITLTS